MVVEMSTMLKQLQEYLNRQKGRFPVQGTIAPMIELGAGFDLDLTAREKCLFEWCYIRIFT